MDPTGLCLNLKGGKGGANSVIKGGKGAGLTGFSYKPRGG